ncbi:tRNA-dihydrouridine synthase [Halalkaliarchaeum sp. AArc-CO]|uniref:tRNA-dihydrouridine synthase n=1 Tax=Halalkaliarchaeum sp. AArc-GB TaxID=3074078 RepID=UPI0028601B60|nr:tRNA-dihydrouridine synthase [Halalkaliarchaeum sp. AArc-GB]MDR5672952.1 tRNA-dihydrouridine synthase [Halalkaliarchaeum sp. AArc-GB]UWG50295.1 tRNA-dihydrouridine synthase [Halalkaliarchaeum sp. AArc-CO]
MTRPSVPFSPAVAAASLSGQSDAEWAKAAAPYVGCAFLGGIALDSRSRDAARGMRKRDREEFLPDDPIEFIRTQLEALEDVPIRAGINVRSSAVEPIQEAAVACASAGAILEVNAHCRQEEMCAIGCGESLLRNTDRLCEYVSVAAETGATVSVKVRTEVDGVDLPETARQVAAAGVDVVHVDAMDSEPVVGAVVDTLEAGTDATVGRRPVVVANNGVRDRETVREYLGYGADAVSVGRPSDDPEVLSRVREAVVKWFENGTAD